MEKENTSRPHPYSKLIGCRNRPKPARMPNEIVMMRQPHARTTSGVRQVCTFISGSVPARTACRSGTVGMKKARSGGDFFYLRQIASEDRFPQRLDRLGAREAAPPGEA